MIDGLRVSPPSYENRAAYEAKLDRQRASFSILAPLGNPQWMAELAAEPQSSASDKELTAVIERDGREQAKAERRAELDRLCEGLHETLLAKLFDELSALADKSPRTVQEYANDYKHFLRTWNEAVGEPHTIEDHIPPEAVAWFIVRECERGISFSRVSRIVGSLAWVHALKRKYDPTNDLIVRAALKYASKNEQRDAGDAA